MNRRVLNPDVRQHIPALDMYQPYPQLDNPPTPDVPPCIASAGACPSACHASKPCVQCGYLQQ